MATKTTTPVSERRNNNPTGCLVIFGLFFMLIGLSAFYAAFLRPMMQANAAKSWTPITATIASSSVGSRRGDKKTTYYVQIEYTFPVNGKTYYGNTYQFGSSDAGSFSNAQNQVANLPPGARITVYFDPQNPNQSVVQRNLPGNIWAGLLTLIFVIIGLGIMIGGIWSGRKPPVSATGQSWRPKTGPAPYPTPQNSATAVTTRAVMPVADMTGGPVTLKPRSSRMVAFIFVLIFGLFWNGVVFAGLFTGRSSGGVFLGLFMIPFVLVGLGFAVGTIYCFLALFGPKVELTVSQSAVPLGGTLNVNWKLEGKQNVTKFQIYLEGREEATYRRGTDTYTDRNTFCVLDVTDAMSQPQQGNATVQIPLSTMHSFEARNNKIIWQLVVKGEIPIWPDMKEEYPIVVLPPNAV